MSRGYGTWGSRIAGTLVLVALTWAAGELSERLVLDRSAVARGELWRLWTGHLVHGSAAHYAYDVGAAGVFCAAFGFAARLAWMAPALSLVLLCLPNVEWYYGLSGLLHAWVVAATAEIAAERGPRAGIARAFLLATLAKAGCEAWSGTSLFTAGLDLRDPVLHASHLAGALLGLVPLASRIASRTLRGARRNPPGASRYAGAGPGTRTEPAEIDLAHSEASHLGSDRPPRLHAPRRLFL